MRLIDADALLEKMKHRREYVGRPSDPVCLVEDAPTVDGWVSVTDRLPEENGIYLVCVALGYMDFYTWSDKIWFSSAFNVCDDGFVTHWMSLPEPPKEDDDDAE